MFKNAFLGAIFAALFATAASAGTISVVDAGMATTTGQSGQIITTGTPTANSFVSASTAGATPGMITLTVSGTWTGTLQLLATADGVNYAPWLCSVRGVSGTAITSMTGNGTVDCPGGGVTQWLVRASAFSSGSAVVTPFASVHELSSGAGGGVSGLVGVKGTDGSTIASPSNPVPTTDPSSVPACAAAPCTTVIGATALTGLASGVDTKAIMCDQTVSYDASDNGHKTLITGVSLKKIYICGVMSGVGGVATNLKLGSGTGADCVTTFTAITPAWQLAANQRTGFWSGFYTGLKTLNNADNLCGDASGANAHQFLISYTIQ